MATVAEALYARLTSFGGLSALVGSRIYPNIIPQNSTYPCIIYGRVAAEHFHCMEGSSGLVAETYQIDIFATSKSSAEAIAEQVRLALQGYRGTSAGVAVNGVLLTDTRDDYSDVARLFNVSHDFKIWANEDRPA